MQLADVSLPKLHLSNNEQHLAISLQGSLQLRFPDGVKLPQTSSDLLKLVTEEHLWIARTGSCYFRLVISVQGEHISEGNQIAELMEWIQYCEVWSKAGVRLQGRETSVTEPLGQMSFSIQHPDLSSALVTPKYAFTAEFQSVTCCVDFSPIKRSLKRKRVKETNESIEIQAPSGISLDNQRAIGPLIQDWNLISSRQNIHRDTQGLPQSGKIQKIESSEQRRQLFEIALEMTVLGSGKQYKGVTTNNCTRTECLMRLVPAVFNVPYLKAISDRASFLPIIATSLARMKNAESPSLRYKTIALAARVVDENGDHGDRVIRGIEKGTWEAMLSSIKMPTRSHQARRNVERATSNTEVKYEVEPCEPNSSLPETQAEERDHADNMKVSVDEHPQMESYEVGQTLFQQNRHSVFESHQYITTEMQVNNHALLPGPFGDYVDAGINYSLDVPEMKLMSGPAYSFATDSTASHYTMNHDPSSLDLQPLVTFNEWLCPGESIAEHTGASCERTISYGYEEGNVSFYKSYE